MLLKIKNYFKYKLPRLYRYVRDLLFPIYVKLRSRNLKKFLHYVKDINFNGVKYKLVLRAENGFVDEEIYWKGVYEEEVMLTLQKEIVNAFVSDAVGVTHKSEILFLDIGANIGQELIFAGAIARDILNKNNLNIKNKISFKVIGFEPISRLYDQVNESIKANNFNNVVGLDVQIMNYALGDKNEELMLKSPVINVGGSSLVRNESNTVGEIREEKIVVKKGDDIIYHILKTQASLKLIIKIDVEGYEYEVIKGLRETIKRYSPTIIIEYSPVFYIEHSAMGDRSKKGIDTLEIFKEENYRMEVIDIGEYKNKTYKGEEIISWAKDFKGEQANLLFIPR